MRESFSVQDERMLSLKIVGPTFIEYVLFIHFVSFVGNTESYVIVIYFELKTL